MTAALICTVFSDSSIAQTFCNSTRCCQWEPPARRAVGSVAVSAVVLRTGGSTTHAVQTLSMRLLGQTTSRCWSTRLQGPAAASAGPPSGLGTRVSQAPLCPALLTSANAQLLSALPGDMCTRCAFHQSRQQSSQASPHLVLPPLTQVPPGTGVGGLNTAAALQGRLCPRDGGRPCGSALSCASLGAHCRAWFGVRQGDLRQKQAGAGGHHPPGKPHCQSRAVELTGTPATGPCGCWWWLLLGASSAGPVSITPTSFCSNGLGSRGVEHLQHAHADNQQRLLCCGCAGAAGADDLVPAAPGQGNA